MSAATVLVAGATGQVGSQVVRMLEANGHRVRALVRRPDARVHGASGALEYAVGSLEDRDSLDRALVGIDTVVSSANAIIPSGRTMSVRAMNDSGYDAFVAAAEAAGVRRWVQSSVPSHALESSVLELAGKRLVERRLADSPIVATICRNPAFTDVWLVMGGALQASAKDPHATTRRPFGFMRLWQGLTGNLVAGRGLLLAPGGANHGAPFITTTDVARIMAAAVSHPPNADRIIESGGPEWLTWREVAERLSVHAGRKVRCVPMPAWFAAMGQTAMRPIVPSASNVLALVRFVATHQPRWEAPPIVAEFGLPPQVTVAEYLKANWEDGRRSG